MSNKWLGAKLMAALLLCFGAVESHSAFAYTDATPYGLVYASGTETDTTNWGAIYGFGGSTTQHQISVAFFRPFSAPATSDFGTGWLPGSITVKNSDGSTVVDLQNLNVVTPDYSSYIYFPLSTFPNGYGGVPVTFSTSITYKGHADYLYVNIYPAGIPSSFPGNPPTIQVMIYRFDSTGFHMDFYSAGTLAGAAIVDP